MLIYFFDATPLNILSL